MTRKEVFDKMKPVRKLIDNRKISIYPCGEENAPVVYSAMYSENGKALLDCCETAECPAFHLVTISELDWNADLSPWAAPSVVTDNDGFAGNAGEFTGIIRECVIPFAESITGAPSYRIIAGYSMAGLYALYAPYITDIFSKSVCASGSVWYEGFVDFAENNGFIQPPDCIYLSLGDLESRTKNPVLSRVENCMDRLYHSYTQLGIPTVFEMNKGNHYKNAVLRLAKGIAWGLKN